MFFLKIQVYFIVLFSFILYCYRLLCFFYRFIKSPQQDTNMVFPNCVTISLPPFDLQLQCMQLQKHPTGYSEW